MKKLLTLCLLAGSLATTAQCTFTIPISPGHVKITTNQTINAIGTIYWICDGVDVIVNSSPGSVFVLEEYATITFTDSDGDEVYAKSNCIITNNSTADIGVTVNPSTVTLNNTSSGTITTTTSCTSVVYNYAMVGGTSGCSPVTGVAQVEQERLQVYPNPAGETIFINGLSNESFTVVDLLGNTVQSGIANGKTTVQLNGLSKGIYFIRTSKQSIRFLKV